MAEKPCNLLKNGGGMSEYSTSPVKIGKWYDGKDLYRQVISVTTPSTANTNTNVYASLDSSMTIVNIGGMIYWGTTTDPVNYYIDSTSRSVCWRRNDNNIGMNVGSNMTNLPADIIIEFIK